MKMIFPVIAAIVALLPASAHADEKADAVLKEVRLHMRNITAYSVTLQFEEAGKKQGRVRIVLQRPDKYLFGISDVNKPEIEIILNAGKAAARQNSQTFPMPDKDGKDLVKTFAPILSAEFGKVFTRGVKDTKYITQKMLDETTVVDVVDIIGGDPNDNIRVYVDNNSLIRKIVSLSKDKGATMYFLNPTTNPLITAKTFAVE